MLAPPKKKKFPVLFYFALFCLALFCFIVASPICIYTPQSVSQNLNPWVVAKPGEARFVSVLLGRMLRCFLPLHSPLFYCELHFLSFTKELLGFPTCEIKMRFSCCCFSLPCVVFGSLKVVAMSPPPPATPAHHRIY